MQIEQTRGNTWRVNSDSGGVYTVHYCGSGDGDPEYVALWECTCPAGHYGKVCKHVHAVSVALDAVEYGEALPQGITLTPDRIRPTEEIEMSMKTEVTGIRVVANDNYTCKNNQFDVVHIETRVNRVSLAVALDMADNESRERKAYSGMGAGAKAEIVFSGDILSPMAEAEEFSSLQSRAVQQVPLGTDAIRRLRKFISMNRNELSWDGHNWCLKPVFNSKKLLKAL